MIREENVLIWLLIIALLAALVAVIAADIAMAERDMYHRRVCAHQLADATASDSLRIFRIDPFCAEPDDA